MERAHIWCRAANDQCRVTDFAQPLRNVSSVIAWRAVALLECPLMLFVHYHESQVADRREDAGA